MGKFKMAQSRSKPWTIVHAFGSILSTFEHFQKHVFLSLTLTESAPYPIHCSYYGLLSNKQEKNGQIQDGQKSIKTMP